ncbi:hypothetical protein B0H63DRAFT_444190 [Podospora didyma]|uniref:Uncharacterized protein n=1 Tax=Podospora didyma TaxID=330526 RepID=A0AAE0P624_9PEZI|nr:hypothetical protein B0H63DRAFT_444190 [Podospora didyma]
MVNVKFLVTMALTFGLASASAISTLAEEAAVDDVVPLKDRSLVQPVGKRQDWLVRYCTDIFRGGICRTPPNIQLNQCYNVLEEYRNQISSIESNTNYCCRWWENQGCSGNHYTPVSGQDLNLHDGNGAWGDRIESWKCKPKSPSSQGTIELTIHINRSAFAFGEEFAPRTVRVDQTADKTAEDSQDPSRLIEWRNEA